MGARRIFGIDLGTTYSCISYVDESGRPAMVTNAEGELTTPSVVYFESADNIVVGKEAKNASKLFPDRTVSFVKRSMGNPTFEFEVDGKKYKAEDISAMILKKVVGDAAKQLGEEIVDVVITCPAYFGINEREATKNAGKIAGLNVHHILNEPTAAAVCYGMEKSKGEDQLVLVYDLGGGTFDITMIEIKGGDLRVIYTDGNHMLGGKDWDDRVITYLADQFKKEHPAKGDPLDDPESAQALVLSAEDTKKTLSAKEKAPVAVSHGGSRSRVELTREKFDELTLDLLGQTVELTKHVLKESRSRGHSQVTQLLLVGGSSKMLSVARALKELVSVEPKLYEPDLAVAKGAALIGLKILAGEKIKEEIATQRGVEASSVDLETVDPKTLQQAADKVSAGSGSHLRLGGRELAALATTKVVNVCSKGFGVVVSNRTGADTVAYLIHNNTALPVEVTETGFSTTAANQRNVALRVMEQEGQAESPTLENNKEITAGDLALPANLPDGAPIHVTFRLAEDGTLEVTATEPSSAKKLQLKATVKVTMSEAEVARSKGLLLKKTVS